MKINNRYKDESCEQHTTINPSMIQINNDTLSCEQDAAIKNQNITHQNKISTYETSMNSKLFTKGNEDSSCEQHTTIKKQLSTYETSMNSKLFTKGNDTSIKVL